MGGCNILLHGAGWLEGGLTASAEKFIIDVEMLQMMAEVLKPLEVDEATLGLDAVAEVGPGGHFFGAAHTIERFKTAFYAPLLSDWRNFETWRDDGSVETAERANRLVKQTLADFQAPALPPERLEAIDAFIAKRTEQGGADLER
jgi:trimethylamine--corrinoid protein Co-methyltransferase